MTQKPKWRARSASDKTDNWPFWYVTDDMPHDRNKLADALDVLGIERNKGAQLFVPRAAAEEIARRLNEASK